MSNNGQAALLIGKVSADVVINPLPNRGDRIVSASLHPGYGFLLPGRISSGMATLSCKDLNEGGVQFREIRLKARNDTRNSLTHKVMRELQDAIEKAQTSPILLCADGESFCSGLDKTDLFVSIQRGKSCREPLSDLISLYSAILNRKALTACAVQGHAVGGGVGLASCCDFVSVWPEAKFTIPKRHYTPLARVLIPVLNQKRKRLGLQPVDNWIGKLIDANLADRLLLADEVMPAGRSANASWRGPLMQRADARFQKLLPKAGKRITAELNGAMKKVLRPDVTLPIGLALIRDTIDMLLDDLSPMK